MAKIAEKEAKIAIFRLIWVSGSVDTAHTPCKCTRGSSSDELGADGGAFGATMPEPFASDGDTAGWPRDSEESPAESLSDDATDHNSDECAVLSDGESSWEESDHTDDSLEDQDKLAASADQLDHLHAPAEDTSPTALELAIQEGRDVDTFEASALMGALDASVYVLPGASNILRAKATIRHGDGRAAVDTVLDSGAGLNLASAEMLRTAADLGLPPIAELHIKPHVKGISGQPTPLGDPHVLEIVHPVAGTQRLVAYKAPHALPESAHVLLGTGAISVTGISLDYHVEHGPGQHIGWRRTLDATGLSEVPTDDAVYVPSGGAGQHCKVLDAAGDSVEIALDSQTHTWVRREDVLGCGPRIDCLAATPHTANATAASRSFEASLLEIFSGEGHLSGAVARAGGGVLPAIDKIHGDGLTSPATRDRVLKRLSAERQAGRAVGRVSMPDLLGLAADAQAPARAQDHQASR